MQLRLKRGEHKKQLENMFPILEIIFLKGYQGFYAYGNELKR